MSQRNNLVAWCNRWTAMLAVGCLLAASAAAQAPASTGDEQPATRQPAGDEAAIRASAEAYEKAFAAGDAKAIADEWTEDGELVDELGQQFKGVTKSSRNSPASLPRTPAPPLR